jgi:hypothetical protein
MNTNGDILYLILFSFDQINIFIFVYFTIWNIRFKQIVIKSNESESLHWMQWRCELKRKTFYNFWA